MPPNMHGKLMLICIIIIYIPADKHMLVEAIVFVITTTHDYYNVYTSKHICFLD